MDTNIGKLNIGFGWAWLLLGILEAVFIGLFAFQSDWLGGFVALTRRLVILSHIAFMALSIVNIIYGLCLPAANLSNNLKKTGSYCMVLASISMPILCLLSARNSFFQNLFFIPVVCFLIAVVVMIIGQFKSEI